MTVLKAKARITTTPDLVHVRLLRLRRPVQRATGQLRQMSAEDPRMLLSAILAEIDETILPRRLDLRRPDGARLRIDVAGRRVLALPEGGGALPDAPDAAARIVARALTDHLGTSRRLGLVVRRLERIPGIAAGCTAAHLALALDVPAPSSPGEDVATGLARALDALAMGWIRLARPGQIAAQGGAPGHARDLVRLSLNMAEDLDPLLGAALDGRRVPGWVHLDTTGGEGLLIARCDDRVTLARIAADCWPDLRARLTTLFATG